MNEFMNWINIHPRAYSDITNPFHIYSLNNSEQLSQVTMDKQAIE